MIYLNGKKVGVVTVDVVEKEIPVEVPVPTDENFNKLITGTEDPEDVITVPEGSQKIRDYAFYKWQGNEVKLPEGLNEMGTNCFYMCPNITKITIPDSVTKIGQSCITWCGQTQGIRIIVSNSLTEIPNYAFLGNIITQINIPASVKQIGLQAFALSSYLRYIIFEGNVPPKADNANSVFQYCDSILHVYVKNFEEYKHYSDWSNTSLVDKMEPYYHDVILKSYDYSDDVVIKGKDTKGIVRHHFIADATDLYERLRENIDYVLSFEYEVPDGPNDSGEVKTWRKELVVGVGEQLFSVNFNVIHQAMNVIGELNEGVPMTFTFESAEATINYQNKRWIEINVPAFIEGGAGNYIVNIESEPSTNIQWMFGNFSQNQVWYTNSNTTPVNRWANYPGNGQNKMYFYGSEGAEYTITVTKAQD